MKFDLKTIFINNILRNITIIGVIARTSVIIISFLIILQERLCVKTFQLLIRCD